MASSRALANQEREVQVQRFGRVAKALLLSLATLMTFSVVVLLIADKLYRPDAFAIDQLKIKGQFQYLAPEAVQKAVFEEEVGNFFSVELSDIKQRIEAMPWVQHADVRREWPHTLSVRVREHRPVMRWVGAASDTSEEKAVEQWVSASGEIISLAKPLNRVSPITLRGNDHDSRELLTHAIRWQKRLASSDIRVLGVSLSASQSWHLTLAYTSKHLMGVDDHEFELLLGREQGDERLTRFQALFDTQFKYAEQKLIRVDARYPDGVAVLAKPLEVKEPVKLKETAETRATEAVSDDMAITQILNSFVQTASLI